MEFQPSISVDVEPTNRCNADCYFCPRDQTPDQGLMTPETFAATLHRARELREVAAVHGYTTRISLCGLGEPLLNKHVPSFVRQASEDGFEVSMSSNAGLLDERRATAVLDAGLTQIDINVGERGGDYEDIYKLDWETTRDNILRFKDLAEGRCKLQIILVNHRGDRRHLADMETYWRDLGLEEFFSFNLMNRGGSLEVENLSFDQPEHRQAADLLGSDLEDSLCRWPFSTMVVGYDGRYYLCCSDWKKEYPLGTVHDVSFLDLIAEKLDLALHKATICQSCSIRPANALAEELVAITAGEKDPVAPAWLAGVFRAGSRAVAEMVDCLEPGAIDTARSGSAARRARKLIPVVGL